MSFGGFGLTSGALTNRGTVTIGDISGTGGIVIKADIDNYGSLDIQSTDGLTLNKANGVLMNYGTTTVGSGLTLTLSGPTFENALGGVLRGAGTVNTGGKTLNNAGVISVGAPTSTLTIVGSLSQSTTSVVAIEIGSLTQYDRLAVGGTANLDGSLDVRLLGGYIPDVGDSFQVMTFGSRSGDFATSTGLDIGGGLYFDPVYDGTSLTLLVQSIPVADLAVSKSDERDPSLVDLELTYTLVVTNDGPDAATDVVLTDTLPPEVSFASVTSTQGSCGESGGTVTCDLGTLANGASSAVDITVLPGSPGTLQNTASVSTASSFDPDDTNNTAVETTVVGFPGQVPGVTWPGMMALATAFAILLALAWWRRGPVGQN